MRTFVATVLVLLASEGLADPLLPNQGAPAVIAGLKSNNVIPQILPSNFTPSLMVAVCKIDHLILETQRH
jgi:hypothetical protein